MEISRRDFLIFLGVSGALAGGASEVWSVPDGWADKLASGPRIETWRASTCTRCPGGCGIRVRLVDGIPVRIHGNPLAPVNKGSLCPMGEAGLELLYHPDRIKQPMRRRGKKGESDWEPISWEEASKQIVQVLQALQSSKRQDQFGFLMGDRNTKLTEFAGLFTAGLGSPQFMPWRSPTINELGLQQAFTAGETKPLSLDVTQADYLLTFGTNLLEEPPSPIFFNRIYGSLKEKRSQSGLKMVHVDARMSQAGRNATEWVQIRPGTMGSFAMGIAYVLIRDKNFDQDFIARHTKQFGVEGSDFLELVTNEFSPEKVASITGIPAATILRVAREFGSAKAPLALSGGPGDASETSVFSQWAVASLNALKGGFSSNGLWREAPRLPGDSPAPATTTAAPEAWAASNLPLQVLMIAQANPIFQAVNQQQWKDWLSRIGLVVQFATLLDETSPFADLILPVPTYLEQWDLTLPVPSLPFSQAGLQQPVVQGLGEARPMGEVLLHLSKAVGLHLLPGGELTSYEDYVKLQAQKVFTSGRGTPFFEEVSLEFLNSLRDRGWQFYSYPAFTDFWQLLMDKGGWWDPSENPPMSWSTGRTFLFPTRQNLEALLTKAEIPGGQGATGRKALSLWNKGPVEDQGPKDSFLLLPFLTLMNMDGTGAGESFLQELFGLHMRQYWHSWAELHPKRAEALGIQDGDLIRLSTRGASCQVRAKVVPTVSEGIVAMPYGQGHSEMGRYAKGIGTNPLGLLDLVVDPLSGRHSWVSTHVRVERIGN